jgi:uncharacterized membrane protein YfcA
MTLSSFLLLLSGGAIAGMLGTLLGIGGGLFLVPFLVLVAGVPMHQAIATSIVAVIATSSTGASVYLKRGLVNMRFGMLLEVTTVIGAIAGGLTANMLTGPTLAKIFSAVMFFVALLMLRRTLAKETDDAVVTDGAFASDFTESTTGKTVRYSVKRIPGTMFVSLLAGNLSGLLGIGGGVFKVPAMHLISGMPIKAAAATSNFMIGVTAAASAFIYFSKGHLNPALASAAVLGVLGGSFLGTRISQRIHGNTLVWIFVVVLLVVSVQMFLR